MGRGKIDIKRIENASSRQVTFAKRKAGLIKKAQELAILCDADVGLIIFSSSGKRFEFASSSMQNVIKRYMKCTTEKEAFNDRDDNLQELKKWHRELNRCSMHPESLQSTNKHLIGDEIQHLNLHDLSHLEKQMDFELSKIRTQKGFLLLQHMEDLTKKEKQLQAENKDLKTKIEEIQRNLKEAKPSSTPRGTLPFLVQPTQPNLCLFSSTKKPSSLELF